MERFYQFAGLTFRIYGKMEDMKEREGVLEPFRVEAAQWDHSIEFEVVSELPEPEGKEVFVRGHLRVYRSGEDQLNYVGSVGRAATDGYMCIRRRGSHSHVQVIRSEIPAGITPRLVLNALQTEHYLTQRDRFLLHASFICWNDRAILFTAPSGTGKSTQAELWRSLRGAEVINGDRAAISLESDGVTAWGVPYCGTSGICRNARLPVAAIVYLSQAPETAIRRLKGLQAFRHVWEGCSVNVWDECDVSRCVQTVMAVTEQTPVFHLACTPDVTAVEALETMLRRGSVQNV